MTTDLRSKRDPIILQRLYGVTFSEVHVRRLLEAMDFSSKKPERRAIWRNEADVQAWKRKTWPALKNRVPAARRRGAARERPKAPVDHHRLLEASRAVVMSRLR